VAGASWTRISELLSFFAPSGGDFGLIGGHSLSWMSEKGARCGSIMIAKVWTPENPNNGRPLLNGSGGGGGTPFLDEN